MVTLFLATVIGWYVIIASLLMLFRFELLKSAITDIMALRGLFFLMAIFTVIMGLLLVTSHNIWIMGWPVIITIFSWMVLISGIIRLFFPDSAIRMGKSYLNNPIRMKIASFIFLLIGIFLLFNVYVGYFG